MRRIPSVLLGLFVLALVLLLGSGLVRGPEEAESAAAARPLQETALLPGAAGAVETPEAAASHDPPGRGETAVLTAALPMSPAGDGGLACGLHLGSLPWYRAAWAACPPEGCFG